MYPVPCLSEIFCNQIKQSLIYRMKFIIRLRTNSNICFQFDFIIGTEKNKKIKQINNIYIYIFYNRKMQTMLIRVIHCWLYFSSVSFVHLLSLSVTVYVSVPLCSVANSNKCPVALSV